MAQACFLKPKAELQQPIYSKIGDYLISDTIGKGLMEVKLAVDPNNQNQTCAVKICKNLHQKHNLEQEAAILKELHGLSIPNIVGFRDFINPSSSSSSFSSSERFSSGGRMIGEGEEHSSSSSIGNNNNGGGAGLPEHDYKCAMVLDYAPNYTIFDYLSIENAFDEKLARTYFQKLIQILHNLHSNGYTHRDVKPENLLLDKDFDLVLADFGYAQKFDKLTGDRSKIRCGTESYMCPGMFVQGKSYSGCKADVFATGIILFIMIWGRPPFFNAKPTDPFYKNFALGTPQKYWHVFETKLNGGVQYNADLKDTINAIFAPKEADRPDTEELSNFRWLNEEVYSQQELAEIMSTRKMKLDEEKENQKQLN